MSYRVIQHVPDFVDSREPRRSAAVETYDEALSLPFVNEWSADNQFARFQHVVDGDTPNWVPCELIVAHMVDGTSWVVAYLFPQTAGAGRWTPDQSEAFRKGLV